MSNRSYLMTSNMETIYPSNFEDDFDFSAQILASDVEAIPVLWLALFREQDLTTVVIDSGDEEDDDGEPMTLTAPRCTVEKALSQLDAAAPLLKEMFGAHGDTDSYVAMFRNAIAAAGHKYISMEIVEIESLLGDDRIAKMVQLALRGWEKPDGIHFEVAEETIMIPKAGEIGREIIEGADGLDFEEALDAVDAGDINSFTINVDFSGLPMEEHVIEGFELNSHAEVLLALAQTVLDEGEQLPSVRMYLDDLEYTDEDQWNFTRFLGAGLHGSMGYGREVPWEKEEADFGFELRGLGDE